MALAHTEYDGLIATAGTDIFREGDHGSCAYLLEKGRVQISVRQDGEKVVLAERGPGEIFGEMAIIDNQPRSATITALEDCELLLITREQLSNWIEAADPILRLCLHFILHRFRATISRLHALETGGLTGPHVRPIDAGRVSGYEAAIAEIKFERELESAIEREDFELHFQPIIDLQANLIAGFESLARWSHEARGLISPMTFIPVAEQSGLIVYLSRLCLRQACQGLRRLQGAETPHSHIRDDMFVSVNVSGRDFDEDMFVANIMRTLNETGADPNRLKLEITETVLMQRPDKALAALQECRIRGISIAIDDFGAGYSSLGYLHKFPIDTLKIDRSFIMAMMDDNRSLKIVQSVLSMADEMEIPVVAEGVETADMAARLRDMGCAMAQGYFYARPMPRHEAAEFVRAWRAPALPTSMR